MPRRFAYLLLAFLLCLPALASAQGAPDQVNIALQRLSGEVNRNLTLNDLDNWRWAQDLYPDLSLGCPQPDTAYAQIGTQGYKFLLTYEGVTYDYRVSADGKVAFLCNKTGEGETAGATPTPVGEETIDTSVACPEPEPGVVYLPQRLTSGIQARVVAGPPIVQRSEPSDNGGVLGEVPAGAIVNITSGPVCAEGQLWWQVDFDGHPGWAVEGRDGSYWLETMPALPLPPDLPAMSTENISGIGELSRAEANVTPALAMSPDGGMVAVLGGAGTSGVWMYSLMALDAPARLLRGTVPLTDVAYSPDGSLLLLGDAQGGIRLWSTEPDTTLLERWFDQGHEKLTTAVAFAPDGQTVASVGDVAVTGVEIDKNNAIVLWDVESVRQTAALAGHTGTVNALAYSRDGRLLASASDDQSVRLWNPADGSSVAVLSGHSGAVKALAFSPDGSMLASADDSGAIILWDMASQAQSQTMQQAGPVSALAFSPDGMLLAASGGDEDTPGFDIHLWDVAGAVDVAQAIGHTDSVGGLAFNRDGTVLVSASDDKSVRFWGIGGVG